MSSSTKTRTSIRTVITKLFNEVVQAEESPENPPAWTSVEEEVRERLHKLRTLEQSIESLDEAELRKIADETEHVAELEKILDYQGKVYKLKLKLQKFLDQLQPRREQNDGVSVVDQNQTQANQILKLPPLQLPTFDGELTEFFSFWEQFKVAIHLNDSVPAVQKMQYLLNCLHGPARECIRNVPHTECGYKIATDLLTERYSDKEMVGLNIFSSLLDVAKVQKRTDVKALTSVHEKVKSHMLTLESLQLTDDYYGGLLYAALLRVLPDGMVYDFFAQKKKLSKEKDLREIFMIRFRELLDFLLNEIINRSNHKMVSNKFAKDPKPSKPLTSSPATASHRKGSNDSISFSNTDKNDATRKCIFCDQDHASQCCSRTIDDRVNRSYKRSIYACYASNQDTKREFATLSRDVPSARASTTQ